jgi:hypothetical protein
MNVLNALAHLEWNSHLIYALHKKSTRHVAWQVARYRKGLVAVHIPSSERYNLD